MKTIKDYEGKTLIVVPTFMRSSKDADLTVKCLRGLEATVPEDHYIMVVDDGSPYKRTKELLNQLYVEIPQFRALTIKEENQGFGNSVNKGLMFAQDHGMDCMLVNADIEFHEPRWFHHMIATEGGVVGAKLLFPTGLIQHAGIYFSVVTRTFDHLHKFGPADLMAANFKRKCPVTGALQLIKHETIEAVGLYDESFKMGWEDVDYCLRVFLSGRYCVYNPDVSAIHHESAFRGNRTDQIDNWTKDSFYRLYNKHAGVSFGEFVPMLIGQDPMAGNIEVLV